MINFKEQLDAEAEEYKNKFSALWEDNKQSKNDFISGANSDSVKTKMLLFGKWLISEKTDLSIESKLNYFLNEILPKQ